MSVENPRGENVPLRSELSPIEQLRVASISIIDAIGVVLDDNGKIRKSADWEDDNLGLRFMLNTSRSALPGSATGHHLKVYEQFAHGEPIERYYYESTSWSVQYCDEKWKALSDHPHHDNILVVLTYLATASTLTDDQSQAFMNIMAENQIFDPRVSARLRRFARNIFKTAKP